MAIPRYKNKCPLCRLVKDREIITKVFYDSSVIMGVYCKDCDVPMVIWCSHGLPNITEAGIHGMEDILKNEAVKFFGGNKTDNRRFFIDRTTGKVHYHWHFHARPMEERESVESDPERRKLIQPSVHMQKLRGRRGLRR